MIDTDHPESAYVFAASNQLDFILKFARNITLGTGKHRRDLFLIVEPAFAALRWLNAKRYKNDPVIEAAIVEFEQALKTLSAMPHDSSSNFDRKQCPVCRAPVTEVGVYRPYGVSFSVPAERYCAECLKGIIPPLNRLQSCESGFGTEAI